MAALSESPLFVVFSVDAAFGLAPRHQDEVGHDRNQKCHSCPDVGHVVFPGHDGVDLADVGGDVPVEREVGEAVEEHEEDVGFVHFEAVQVVLNEEQEHRESVQLQVNEEVIFLPVLLIISDLGVERPPVEARDRYRKHDRHFEERVREFPAAVRVNGVHAVSASQKQESQ